MKMTEALLARCVVPALWSTALAMNLAAGASFPLATLVIASNPDPQKLPTLAGWENELESSQGK